MVRGRVEPTGPTVRTPTGCPGRILQYHSDLSCVASLVVCHPLDIRPAPAWLYMDKYGDCFSESYISVDGDEFTIRSEGGAAYDTLICAITFKSVRNDRLCLSFQRFEIDKCGVNFHVFSEQSAVGTPIASYNCHTEGVPETICSVKRYLTILLKKKELSHDGYKLTMELREMTQSDAFAEGLDAFILSIGVIVAIIVGVIVLVVIVSVVVVCCCCKHRHPGRYSHPKSSVRTGTTDIQMEPSAPPCPPDDVLCQPPAYSDIPPPYSASLEPNAPPCAIIEPNAPPEEKVLM